MIDPILFLAFIPAALALNLTPGADMMFCFAQGARSGPRAALAASAGISAGALVHVALAGMGLGALVVAFPWVFGAIRWIGAAYLVWLAWKTWHTPLTEGGGHVRPSSRAFRDGLIVNLSNPKVILFILALVPQFIDPALPVLPQFLACGAVLAVGGFVVNGLVGVFSGRIGRVLVQSPRAERGLRGASSTIFAALAARIGWEAIGP
ncbi:LysE family translocator [Roseicyclus mahoneyensis]|uniref:Threonine/homoserine/homoserine lactone efflux protein n=1 Tax=Roseicyclus mahoneyensis TaxID=164332 RepID=A0A316GGZ4_9RHOB|nr:LysE family translocator [Roseicyclus mahoneyensis]PWK59879.1 threonine/homoserine/homoserine lactone efflux protein [Roseicyclus mahoneyensis]